MADERNVNNYWNENHHHYDAVDWHIDQVNEDRTHHVNNHGGNFHGGEVNVTVSNRVPAPGPSALVGVTGAVVAGSAAIALLAVGLVVVAAALAIAASLCVAGVAIQQTPHLVYWARQRSRQGHTLKLSSQQHEQAVEILMITQDHEERMLRLALAGQVMVEQARHTPQITLTQRPALPSPQGEDILQTFVRETVRVGR